MKYFKAILDSNRSPDDTVICHHCHRFLAFAATSHLCYVVKNFYILIMIVPCLSSEPCFSDFPAMKP